jgi:hypothetical protein
MGHHTLEVEEGAVQVSPPVFTNMNWLLIVGGMRNCMWKLWSSGIINR